MSHTLKYCLIEREHSIELGQYVLDERGLYESGRLTVLRLTVLDRLGLNGGRHSINRHKNEKDLAF